MPLNSHLLRLLSLAVVACAIPLSAQEAANSFDRLKLDFQVRRAEIQKRTLDEPQAALNAKYQGFLAKLRDAAAEKGQLDQALAMTKAIEEFTKGTMPDGSATDPGLKRAQEIHRTESAAIRAAHGKEFKPLIEAYQRQLGDLVTVLTKGQQFQAALAARQEIEAMAALLKEWEVPSASAPPPNPSAAAPATLSEQQAGRLKAFGKFYGGQDLAVSPAGNANRFLSVLPIRAFGWIALRSNGSVATNTLAEVPHFRGRIVKLGSSDLRDTFAGIDSTGRLQVVHPATGPRSDIPRLEKRIVQFSINLHQNKEGFLALLEDCTVKHWGSGYEGAGAKAPPAAALSGIRAIASNANFSYAVRTDGKVVSWKLGSEEVKVPDQIADVVDVAAGYDFAVALTSKGEVMAWGLNSRGQCNVPQNLGRCVAIRASSEVGAAKQENGKWVAWGSNKDGLLDKINSLGQVIDLAFFASDTQGYHGFLLWIE